MKKKYRKNFVLALALCAVCAAPAHALDYNFDGPEDYLFAQPTSDSRIYEQAEKNVDRSKNVSLAAPGFGTPTSYLPGSGEYLTPNLVPGALSGGLVNSVAGNVAGYSSVPDSGSVTVPASGYSTSTTGFSATDFSADASDFSAVDNGSNFTASTIHYANQTVGYTDVTDDLYYSGGHLGTLSIPAIGVDVKIYQGTDSGTLAKGIGHFTDTSIWSGNVCLAAHNRGANNYFGQIHTLSEGDTVTLTTALGTRNYAVTSVEKIDETDNSHTVSTSDNRIILFTCVRDERAYRWCIQAVEQ